MYDTEFLREHPRMPVKEVAQRLGRRENSVHSKRKALGIRSHDWTGEEDKIVRMHHDRLPAADIAALLPGRTALAVATRARLLGLHSGVFWKAEEIEFLRANPGMGAAEAARTLGKTLHAVNHKRRSLGMARRQERKEWSAGDRALLSDLTRDGATARDIAAKMNRTKTSVQNMQRNLGLGVPRSEKALQLDEEKFLRDNPGMPAVEIARHIGRTPGAVRAWRRKIGLARYQEHRRWTRDETKLLEANLQRPLSEIYALFPGRPPASVNAKADSLGRKRLRRKGHTYGSGYRRLLQRGGGAVWEHRRVAEKKIGRPLRRGEVVHHINHIRHDNRPTNLAVLESGSAHAQMPSSVNGLVRGLLEGGAIGYDRTAHSYFFPSRSFDPAGPRAPTRCGCPAQPYVFCGDRIFPFSLRPGEGLADTLGALPLADSVLPIEGRHAVVLCGAAASPARLEAGLGAAASPFPVVKGTIADHDVAPVRRRGSASAAAAGGSLVRDALKASSGASAVVWAALLDSRQLGAMDACAGRGRLCDMVEVLAPVEFENGEGLYPAHLYVPRGAPPPVYGSRATRGPPPRLSCSLQPLVRSRARRRTR